MYKYTLSLTSELVTFECSMPRTDSSTAHKRTRCPLYRTVGGPSSRSVLDDTLQYTAETVVWVGLHNA